MMEYDMAQSQYGIQAGGCAQTTALQPARTFDGISGALDRVRQYNGQMQRILQRIMPGETFSKTASGEGSNNIISPPRASYASSLEQLQDALGILGRSLDELEGHI